MAKERIDRRDTRDAIETIVLETLAPEQFRHAHLPGAVNMPPDRQATDVRARMSDPTYG
jgi:hypothetical protein